MLETEYRIAKGISYVILFVGFVISVKLIPFIQKQLVNKMTGLSLVAVSYIIAFLLMIIVIPKIAVMFMKKS